MLENKKILLLISGGIGAVKIPELISQLKDKGADVFAVMTPNAQKFITPLSISTLSKNTVHQSLFNENMEAEIDHIALSRRADIILVAPATADIMARLANGHAHDLSTCLLLASDKPVIMAPAMNTRMWHHPATQRNVSRLIQDGVELIGPDEGEMACGEFGLGRMVEIKTIIDALERRFFTQHLKGKRAIVTSGATREALDPVRFLSNYSSGHQGTAIAASLAHAGAEVCFITGAADTQPPHVAQIIKVETAADMFEAVNKALPADIAILVAAVSDWRLMKKKPQKLKKHIQGQKLTLDFVQNTDILKNLAQKKENRPALIIGFAAETENLFENAQRKLEDKACDWIIGNDVSRIKGVMGQKYNEIILLKHGQKKQVWPRLTKEQTANRLVDEIIHDLT